MEKSQLVPFLRENLDLLFVGLNPAKGSSENKHYFSVRSSFWDQLKEGELITAYVDKMEADTIVFGNNDINHRNWNYGITDLVPEIAESDSSQIDPLQTHCEKLKNDIIRLKPRAVCLLHRTVEKSFLPHIGCKVPQYANTGELGKLITGIDTMFFAVAFPHGSGIKTEKIVAKYKKIKAYLSVTEKE